MATALPRKRLTTPNRLRADGGVIDLRKIRNDLYGWSEGIPDAPKVNVWGMMGLSAARRCIEAIAGDLASLPLNLVKVRDDDSIVHMKRHALYDLFRWSPDGGLSTPSGFRRSLLANTLAWGNGYAEIAKANDKTYLRILEPAFTSIDFGENGSWFYSSPAGRLPGYNVVHVAGLGSNGFQGFSPVKTHPVALGLTVTAERFGSAFLANGAFPSGYIKADAALGDDTEAYVRLRDAFIARHAEGTHKAGRVGVLPPGFDFTKASVDPEVAQFLETRLFQILEICRIFGVPPYRVMQYENMHYSTVEAVKAEFATTTLMPWSIVFEESLNLRLLTEAEVAKGLTFKHDFTAFLKADTQGRALMIRTMYDCDALVPNEIRAGENYGPIDGGDKVKSATAAAANAAKSPALPAPAPEPAADAQPPEAQA
ncbi:phage portal protein [Paludisphaera rhizosphaerae]|uniref:phage portal protein n=1 Tax=Paludisphaera rhizosphaerae TaxID=2711216 RepID=UPI0013E9CC42|nr:phage portal protein [Paludisphaera rhizosphaerae]